MPNPKICQHCYVATYAPHPELPQLWFKCLCCGHCIKVDQEEKELIKKRQLGDKKPIPRLRRD